MAPRSVSVELLGKRTPVPELEGMPEIDMAFANFGDYGYGRFLLDPASRDAVLERPEIVEGTLLRSLVFGSERQSRSEILGAADTIPVCDVAWSERSEVLAFVPSANPRLTPGRPIPQHRPQLHQQLPGQQPQLGGPRR